MGAETGSLMTARRSLRNTAIQLSNIERKRSGYALGHPMTLA